MNAVEVLIDKVSVLIDSHNRLSERVSVLERASEAQPPKEVSPSAQGCRDANASSNPKLISSVVVETKAEPPGTELLPCPFCGSAAVLYEDAKGCMVVCQETNNPPCDIGNTHNDWTREAVIAMWNRRAGTKSFQPGGAPPCGERARLDNSAIYNSGAKTDNASR